MLDIKIEKNIKINKSEINSEINFNKTNNSEINPENNLNKINNLEKIKNNYFNNEIINKNNTKINFIKLDNRIFKEKEIDISEMNSQEELIETIDSIDKKEDAFYKIILTGSKNTETNINEICKLNTNENILKIQDRTKIKYDFDMLSKQNNLKGIFVKRMLKKLEDGNYNQDEIIKAIEIGLKSFE